LQCVAVCCSARQCVAVCCSVLYREIYIVMVSFGPLQHTATHCNTLQHIYCTVFVGIAYRAFWSVYTALLECIHGSFDLISCGFVQFVNHGKLLQQQR